MVTEIRHRPVEQRLNSVDPTDAESASIDLSLLKKQKGSVATLVIYSAEKTTPTYPVKTEN